MEVIINKNGQETVVGLVGRLDTPASIEIAPQIEELKESTAGTVILDCKALEYISSSGLRLFLGLRKAASEKGGKIVVSNISPDIRNVFMMTGFLNLFEIR